MRKGEQQWGFTLIELIVATTMLAVIMGAVYAAFNSSLRLCRMAEENLAAYQEARIALGIMRKDLYAIVPGSWHLFEGNASEFQVYSIVSPMDPDEGTLPRLMWIHYRLKQNPDGEERVLLREERVVEDPLPVRLPGQGEQEPELDAVDLGRKETFEIARHVLGMKVTYLWIPLAQPQGSLYRWDEKPERIEPLERDEPNEEWGMPQGIRLSLTVADPASEEGEKVFTTTLTFRGSVPTAPMEEAL